MGDQDKHHRMSFASLSGKPVDAVFDGGILTSDSGVMLLREAEARIGILHRMVAALTDHRHPSYVDHQTVDLVKQRVFQNPSKKGTYAQRPRRQKANGRPNPRF